MRKNNVKEKLVSNYQDVRSIDQNVKNALKLEILKAVKENDFEQVENLLLKGADPNGKYSWNQRPLIHTALISKNYQMVDYLLSNGANIEETDYYGRTLLIVSCSQGDDTGIIKKWLAKGANINAVSRNGRTPFSCAISRRKMETVAFLMKQGADTSLCQAEYNNLVDHLGCKEMIENLNIYFRKAKIKSILGKIDHNRIINLMVVPG